ncbi:hypothetical protein EAS56_17630 [Bradyrhizobium guangzhouense]|uniref:PspA/IM30 family protein n=1 Tax=Bradyrhizobium guangzhouense TaxID=1325095 RepID=A0ABY0E4W5_9BRAD|nr:hypothetical protein [Bradyrhizobium guangzhouense]RXH12329.1 hypothetical protein EAS56_17630 [Bradyrhizobium guangzhouense]
MAIERKLLPVATRREIVPTQERWIAGVSAVRGPVSGLLFRVQAEANERALRVEARRVDAAHGLIKKYGELFAAMGAAQEAATALHARHELSALSFEGALDEQREAVAEAKHKRALAAQRRERELVEAQTRVIEAGQEQEAVKLFKEEKFQVGLARFKAKVKEHLVGVASAEAAIAEVATPNTSAAAPDADVEVASLTASVARLQADIDEGERLGRDTVRLRKRLEGYRSLLTLVQQGSGA